MSLAFTNAQKAGDLNVVFVSWYDPTRTVTSVTDTAGNKYSLAVTGSASGGTGAQAIYYATNIAASASNTVTVQFNAGTLKVLRVLEYSGVSTTSPLDVAVSGSGSQGTTLTSGPMTTTASKDLVVAGNYGFGCVGSPSTGFTERLTEACQMAEDKVASTAGSVTVQMTQDDDGFWVEQMAAFKAAPSKTPAFVQAAGDLGPQTGAVFVATPNGAQTAGDLNLVTVAWFDPTLTISSVTDTAGNTYAPATTATTLSDFETMQIYYAKNIVAAANNQVAVTFSDSTSFAAEIRVLEYGGLDPQNPIDAVAVASGNALNATSGPVTTTQANDLLVVANVTNQCDVGAGTGFTARDTTGCDLVEDTIEATAGSYSATLAQFASGPYIQQMVALKQATGGGGPCQGVANGTPCNDGNACTQTDTCQSGACVGGNPVTCQASDSCHVAGTCNSTTGTCSNPAAANGTTCNDGNACTQTDACQAGVCTGANPVTCTASDACHTAGTCDPTTGACSNPVAANGTTCDDGNACTQNDVCTGGTCAGTPAGCGPQWPAGSTVMVTSTGAGSAQLTWSAATDPSGAVGGYVIYENGVAILTVPGNTLATTVTNLRAGAQVTFSVQATDSGGASSTNGPSDAYAVPFVPPPLDRGVATQLAAATSFLYTGTNPVQQGVAPGTIVPATVAVIRGNVFDGQGHPLPGATITVANHPELGNTISRADGAYDLAVNGGQALRVHVALAGYLPAERTVQTPWQDYAKADDVMLVQLDSNDAGISFTEPTNFQAARGSTQTDDAGTRTATLLIPPTTTATMTLPDGGTSTPSTLTVRATEYTVGTNGPAKMPATLPPTSAYTYAFELSADEAMAAGATGISFSQPLPYYVENFLSFPVGTAVPVGFYSAAQGAWIPSTNGVVLKILSEPTDGNVTVDATGSGSATLMPYQGITQAELQQLPALGYQVNQTLWRMPIPHFSAWDGNWGYNPPPDAVSPNPSGPPQDGDGTGKGACQKTHSIVDCQDQTLREQLPLAGTPFSLFYSSNRQRGRNATLQIPLSGPTITSSLVSIELEVHIAGRVFANSFSPAQPNQSTVFQWDGMDGYGRVVQGVQPVVVRIGYTYNGTYTTPSRFGAYGGSSITENVTRRQVTLWSEWNTTLGTWDDLQEGLDGWTLDAHQEFDPAGFVLRAGNGTTVKPSRNPLNATVDTIAGTGQNIGSRSPAKPALQTAMSPQLLAVGADQSLYIQDEFDGIWRITPDGLAHFISVGNIGATGFAIGPDGSLFLADFNEVFRVDPSGNVSKILTTGSGIANFGDIALDVQGDLYLVETDSTNVTTVVQVTPDGTSTPVAGGGSFFRSAAYNKPATQLSLAGGLTSIRVAPNGFLYIADAGANVVYQVTPGGTVLPFAGQGLGNQEGAQATAQSLALQGANLLTLAPDGSVLITDSVTTFVGGTISTNVGTVRRVAPDGTMATLVGLPAGPRSSAEGAFASTARFLGIQGAAVSPNGVLYLSDGSNLVRAVSVDLVPHAAAFPAERVGVAFTVGSDDGSQLYEFDSALHHVQTLDAHTGAPLLAFGYDPNGRLQTITDQTVADANHNTTTINRDPSSGNITIVGPFGATTTLTPDANGYLASATDPANQTTQFTYGVDGIGLMATKTDPQGAGGVHQFHFDPTTGRLLRDQDPAGGFLSFTPASFVPGGTTTTLSTAMNVQTTYQTFTTPDGVMHRQNTLPNQLTSSLAVGTNGVSTATAPDGTTTVETDTPDPRLGLWSPVRSVTTTTPSGLQRVVTVTRTTDADASVGIVPFTEQTALDNGDAGVWTRTFDPTSSTWTTTSPLGRTTTVTVDPANRPTTISAAGVQTPVQIAYDQQGRPKTVNQGAFVPGAPDSGAAPQPRTWTMEYDNGGYLSTATDPMDAGVRYLNDSVGRPTDILLPEVDGGTRDLQRSYDGDNNVRSVTLPRNANQEQHQLSYTPVDELQQYTPPSPDAGTWFTKDSYDLDGRLKVETRPDGTTIVPDYDTPGGRLAHLTYPQGTLTVNYYPAGNSTGGASPGHIQSLVTPTGETLTYGYDGPLLTFQTWTGGPVSNPVSVGFGYDNRFRVARQTLNGGSPLQFGYDADDLMTSAGALSPIVRDPQNGRITGTTLGLVTDAIGYDSNGLLASFTAAFSGTNRYVETIVARDGDQRITERIEALNGGSVDWVYRYDVAGRLTDVFKNGAQVSHYEYDADDNRITANVSSGSVNPTYDAQDRLQTYGSTSYAFGANGELQSKTVGNQTTSFIYDVFGNLLRVGLPSGTEIEYTTDGRNRRIAKQVNGVFSIAFVYQDALRPLATVDASGNVVARFVYGTRANVPDYMTKGGGTYRIISDHLGSPRVVVDVATGSVVQQVDYDEFGNVTSDTNPGFQPFGFAGGLYDQDTKLVRFGARDYDASVGRWTAKDPIRFDGGMNLYLYARNDPVNRRDASGKYDWGGWPFAARCCNDSDNDEWAIVGNCDWEPLRAHTCTSDASFWAYGADCDGLTCNGQFFHPRGFDTGTCMADETIEEEGILDVTMRDSWTPACNPGTNPYDNKNSSVAVCPNAPSPPGGYLWSGTCCESSGVDPYSGP
jgi:RHS repeat-associated protein